MNLAVPLRMLLPYKPQGERLLIGYNKVFSSAFLVPIHFIRNFCVIELVRNDNRTTFERLYLLN